MTLSEPAEGPGNVRTIFGPSMRVEDRLVWAVGVGPGDRDADALGVFFEELDLKLELLRVPKVVVVEQGYKGRPSFVEAATSRRSDTSVFLGHDAKPRIADRSQAIACVVGASVVDDDELEVLHRLSQHGLQCLDQQT